LIEALDRIDSITRAEQERLSNLIQQLDTEIQEKVNSMFDDAQWIRENVAQNEYLHQDMTWIGDEINAYLQQVGYWTTDSHGNTITQWSKIQQSVDSISTNVNALSQNVDGRFTAVQSAINQSVDQKIQTAKTEISNMYASGQDVNGVKQVVEWMYSGLKSSAGPDQSVAEIVSAGKNSLVGAISDMRT
jgi:chromosome segregation ATPase